MRAKKSAKKCAAPSELFYFPVSTFVVVVAPAHQYHYHAKQFRMRDDFIEKPINYLTENVQTKQCLQVPIEHPWSTKMTQCGQQQSKGLQPIFTPPPPPPTKEKWGEGVQMLPLYVFHLSGEGGAATHESVNDY